jgi:tripartite-type tricarboxylate transporter receptor subunit TctC
MRAAHRLVVALVLSFASLQIGHAQEYPKKAVKVIIPFPTGGITDVSSRLVLREMGVNLGVPVVVENRPGAGTKLGTGAAIRSPSDGYTLYMSNSSYAVLPIVDPDPGYDPEKDLAPVGLAATYGLAMVVKPDLPVRTLAELVAYAKSNPGKLSYGSAGPGSGTHFIGEYLKYLAGIDIVHVAYRSTSLALQDVAGGVLDVAFDGAAKSYVDRGSVRIIAVVDVKRDPRFPAVPTIVEAGFPELGRPAWLALFAPKGTPSSIILHLNNVLNETTRSARVEASFADMGFVAWRGTPDDLKEQLHADLEHFRKIMTATKLKLE